MPNTPLSSADIARMASEYLAYGLTIKEVRPVTHSKIVELSVHDLFATGADLRAKLGPALAELLAECSAKPGRFYMMEVPAGVNAAIKTMAGISVRVNPIYEGRDDVAKFQIAVAYH